MFPQIGSMLIDSEFQRLALDWKHTFPFAIFFAIYTLQESGQSLVVSLCWWCTKCKEMGRMKNVTYFSEWQISVDNLACNKQNGVKMTSEGCHMARQPI